MRACVELEVTGLPLDAWIGMVRKEYSGCNIVVETGNGETYGERGSLTAAIGPDMQADVIGVWSEEYAFVSYYRTITVAADFIHVTIDLSNQ